MTKIQAITHKQRDLQINNIVPTFNNLTQSVTDPGLLRLTNYMQKTWIQNRIYQITYWFVFGQSIKEPTMKLKAGIKWGERSVLGVLENGGILVGTF